jgi:HPt (histidine-containing phosphotransfer) domain-containing protein
VELRRSTTPNWFGGVWGKSNWPSACWPASSNVSQLELAEIESSLTANDAARLARLTHQLKGTFANVSAEALHAIAIRLEDSARAGRLDEVAACLLEVREGWAAFNRFKAALPHPAQTATR